MSLLTRGPFPGKIGSTNTGTHITPKLTYLEKDPVIVIKYSFPFTCGCFLSATLLEP